MTLIRIDAEAGDYRIEGFSATDPHQKMKRTTMLVELVRVYENEKGNAVLQYWSNDRFYDGGERILAKLRYNETALPFNIFVDALQRAAENDMFIPDFSSDGIRELTKIYGLFTNKPQIPERKSWHTVSVSKPLKFGEKKPG